MTDTTSTPAEETTAKPAKAPKLYALCPSCGAEREAKPKPGELARVSRHEVDGKLCPGSGASTRQTVTR